MGTFSAMLNRFRTIGSRSRAAARRHSPRPESTSWHGRRALLECLEERTLLSIDGLPAEAQALVSDTRVWLSDDVLLPPAEYATSSSGTGLLSARSSLPSASLAPYGATDSDTSEYMIGNVYVTVVLFESNGRVDRSTENWTTAQISQVKSEIQEGLAWWEATMQSATTVASTTPLKFTIDFTYADSPVSTDYEPITYDSGYEPLWINDFLTLVGYGPNSTGDEVFESATQFNAHQRDTHDADWAYTVYVVNSRNDLDGTFSDGACAYSYLGGPWVTMTYDNSGYGIGNMGMVLAHETAHTFYALDEYQGGGTYTEYSGYYNIQNTNAYRSGYTQRTSLMGNAQLMAEAYYTYHTSSTESLQMVGLRDGDNDGIMDVLDVPLTLTGSGLYDSSTGTYTFTGNSEVATLDNQNPYGTGNAITLNTVDLIQYRMDGSSWVNGNSYGATSANVSQTVTGVTGKHSIEFRTICTRTGVTSAVWSGSFDSNTAVTGQVWSDLDANGQADTGEPGLSGWTVYADANDNGQLDSGETRVTTDANGDYSLILLPGTYTIREVLRSGWVSTAPASGSYVVTGAAGETIGAANFGNVQPGTLTGRVWNDANANGVANTGELGLSGWIVYLDADNNGTLDANETRTTTDANGNYTFSQLLPGIYQVRQALLAGWQCTLPTQGYYTATLASNQTVTGNFGDYLPTGVSGVLWNDVDGDARHDADEPALPGWRVYLDTNGNGSPDSGEASTITDSSGSYAFTGLAVGTYTVREVLDPNWRRTSPTSGYHQVTLTSGTPSVMAKDFGNQALPGTIAGQLWHDADNSQTRDTGEAVLSGWRVYVDVDDDGAWDTGELSALTGANGGYTITGVAPGTYTVRDVVPAGWLANAPASGARSVTMTPNATVTGIDFGNLVPGVIRGVVWNDLDGNRQQDTGEHGLSGWTVYLDVDDDGSLDGGEYSTTTSDSGAYTLNVIPTSGTVREVLPQGWACTQPSSGGYQVTVLSGATLDDQNFGNVQPGSITGAVWDDTDGDGLRDAGEAGLSGWQVYADANNNSTLDTDEFSTTTDANGNYLLNVVAGTYAIRQVVQLGYVCTEPVAGYRTVTVAAGKMVDSIDFGDAIAGYIDGTVWNDLNGDGIRSAGEMFLSGWTVYLDANDNGQLDGGEQWTVTDALGAYQFAVKPGDYVVRELLQSGWMQASPTDGHYSVTVTAGQTVSGVDFGNLVPGVVTGSLWNDMDGSGSRDPGEVGLAGWVVYVDMDRDGRLDGNEPLAITDDSGNYTISNVIAGSRTIREVLLRDWKQTYPSGNSHAVTVVAGGTVAGANFGNRPYGAITGVIWNDVDGQGDHDSGEPLLSGWTVYLYRDADNDDVWDADGVQSVTTDGYGYYSFADLPAGDYMVSEKVEFGWRQTAPASVSHEVTIIVGQVDEKNFGNHNEPPTISLASGQTLSTLEDTPLVVAFTVGDAEPDLADLTVTAVSSNPSLVSALELSGSGADRTLTIRPTAEASGEAKEITLTVTDAGGAKASAFFKLTVTPVNDAPTLNVVTGFSLPTILEDADDAGNQGALVADLIASAGGDPITDADTGALEGIAIVDTDPAAGSAWEFSIDGGSHWFDVDGVTPGDALLLAADTETRIRFAPARDFTGTAAIEFHAWDQTSGVNAGFVDVTSNGGSSAFSTNRATATIAVTPVNDAPTFTVIGDQGVNEDSGAQTVSNWATAILAGPANEIGLQAVEFSVVVTDIDPTLSFSAGPAISADGTLTYTAADNTFGTATVAVALVDDGGTANGGADTSSVQTVTITVRPVNDAPSFIEGGAPTVNEDGGLQTIGGWATGISAGPTNEARQTVDFLVTASDPALFSVQPTIDAEGTLRYTPATDVFVDTPTVVTVQLHDSGGTDNGGIDTSASQTFTIMIVAVNDAPAFTKGLNQVTNEDSGSQTVTGWAADLMSGPANEAGQSLDFEVTSSNAGLFSEGPTIDADGTLRYTPAADAFGTATVSVRLHDSGGTDNGGVNTSAAQTFTITLRAVNDAPSFTKGPDQAFREDPSLQTAPGWATGITSGPANEAGQNLSFLVAADHPEYFAVQPAIDAASGTLTYQLAPNAVGTTTVSVQLRDSGGTDNLGQDTSATQTFTIEVSPINDPPTFVKGQDQVADDNAGLITVAGWATGISAGGADETGQTLAFALSAADKTLFSTQPAISVDGTLTFAPRPGAAGETTVTVILSDNGGTANGGEDTSQQTFVIRVAMALGSIGSKSFTDVDVAGKTLWYSLETAHAGYLTAEASDGAAALVLYDQNLAVVANSAIKAGAQRLDFPVAGAGEKYFLTLSGGSNPVDLRVANLVQAGSGGAINVFGSPGADTLEIDGATGRFTINDVVYDLSPRSIFFDGGAGDNTVKVLGTSGNDQFVLDVAARQATLNELTVTFAAATLGGFAFDGLAGTDSAVLRGSSGNETLTLSARSKSGTLTAANLVATVSHTEDIVAYGAGGSDTAILYDSVNNDVLSMTPNAATLAGANGSYSFRVNGFAAISTYGSSGYDQASLYDSLRNDVFESRPAYSRMYMSGVYSNQVRSFDAVYAYASSGYDMARLYDSTGADTFIATPTYSTLSGAGSYSRVRAFDYVIALASQGNDRAMMYDSAGNDQFTAYPTVSTMQGTSYTNRAEGFKIVQAYASTGNDRANLNDSSGVDTLQADHSWVKLYNTAANFSILVSNFDAVCARSNDVAPIVNIQEIGSNLTRDMLFMLGAW